MYVRALIPMAVSIGKPVREGVYRYYIGWEKMEKVDADAYNYFIKKYYI